MDKILELYSKILKEQLSKCFGFKQNINPVELNSERFKIRAVFICAVIFLKNNPKRDNDKIVSAANLWLKYSFANENLFSSVISNSSEDLIKLIDDNLCNLI